MVYGSRHGPAGQPLLRLWSFTYVLGRASGCPWLRLVKDGNDPFAREKHISYNTYFFPFVVQVGYSIPLVFRMYSIPIPLEERNTCKLPVLYERNRYVQSLVVSRSILYTSMTFPQYR